MKVVNRGEGFSVSVKLKIEFFLTMNVIQPYGPGRPACVIRILDVVSNFNTSQLHSTNFDGEKI